MTFGTPPSEQPPVPLPLHLAVPSLQLSVADLRVFSPRSVPSSKQQGRDEAGRDEDGDEDRGPRGTRAQDQRAHAALRASGRGASQACDDPGFDSAPRLRRC